MSDASFPRGRGRTILEAMNRPTLQSRRPLPGSPFNRPSPPPPPVEKYALHDLVSHDKYGLGVVIAVEGEVAVVVNFGPQRVCITTPFPKLTRL